MSKVTSKLLSRAQRLRIFDEATARQKARNRLERVAADGMDGHDWTREELYHRGGADRHQHPGESA